MIPQVGDNIIIALYLAPEYETKVFPVHSWHLYKYFTGAYLSNADRFETFAHT